MGASRRGPAPPVPLREDVDGELAEGADGTSAIQEQLEELDSRLVTVEEGGGVWA